MLERTYVSSEMVAFRHVREQRNGCLSQPEFLSFRVPSERKAVREMANTLLRSNDDLHPLGKTWGGSGRSLASTTRLLFPLKSDGKDDKTPARPLQMLWPVPRMDGCLRNKCETIYVNVETSFRREGQQKPRIGETKSAASKHAQSHWWQKKSM